MELKGNSILITGGSSGLGLQMSKKFLELGNKVIICARSEKKLKEVKQLLPEIITYTCDISDQEQCLKMVEWVKTNHPDLNVLINNAAVVNKTNFIEDDNILDKMEEEVNINFLSPLRLTKMLYPLLIKQPRPTIINITTGLVFIPRADYPIYNSTKAALHSFTQVLRHQLKDKPIKIIEVLFPAVDTPWHKGSPPKIAISPIKAVDEMFSELEKGESEIKVASVKILYFLSKWAPKFAFKKINSLSNL